MRLKNSLCKTNLLSLLVMLATGLLAGELHGQSAFDVHGRPDIASSPSAAVSQNAIDPTDSKPMDATAATESNSIQQTEVYAPLLGGGLFSLKSIARSHLMLGGSSSSGFDSNPTNTVNGPSSFVGLFSPFLEIQAANARTQFIVQYQPSVNLYDHSNINTMHTASANITGSLTPRWFWNASSGGSYGDDSIRLIAPNQSVPVGSVPGSGSSSASYLPNAGVVTNLGTTLDLHHTLSPRGTFGLALSDSYHSSSTLHDAGSVATASFNYSHYATRNLSFQGYQQTAQYYGNLGCTTVGVGAGVSWQPRESTFLSFKGGPQLSSQSCQSQQAFAYSFSMSTNVPGRAQLYFLADRKPVINDLGAGLWQDDVSGGYKRALSRKDSISLDAGYAHSSTLVKMPNYHGTFLYASYTRRLLSGLMFGCNYRSYSSQSGSADFARRMLLFSLSWTQTTVSGSH